ncbi:MAG: SCP2 sterol-binding domain-containing protein [Corticimicrobacter sp.]|uniref:ubiquinone biosynthesis accessory factor UbiJ n=1 Tax=Corticimicrobacter sp. TaxID=2678536 RepID=UPI0032DBC30D
MLSHLIPPPPSALIVRTLNALLAREAWAAQRLAPHHGKTVQVEVGRIVLALSIEAGGTLARAETQDSADVRLQITPAKIDVRKAGEPEAALMEAMRIEGEAALAQVVAELARHLRWDVEEELARRFGDAAGAQIYRTARGAAQGLRTLFGRLASNVAEYVSEEQPMVAGRAVQARFEQDIRLLGEDLRRTQARVARLERQA